MVNNNTQGAIIIAHISKGFIHFASGSISSLNMNPPHSVRCVAKDLDHSDLWSTDHPRAALGTRGSNRKAKTRSMTRVSTNTGFIAIQIRTFRKPRKEAHPALNPINSAKGLRPKLNSAIEEKSEQCRDSSLTYRISSTSYR